ncbi:hypothetical protein [Virgisporangium ochraceum]|uniref:Uncharacterized protein n=1 Tax=Virgisporangium ochraceum TaxID=65505 RepID=A0A8J3ZWJ9_9ACTN|nr:hypothetical protein [Virgisporangium ochraceum]GIJ71432.1 hypothetical protein Voc01_063490 [Virgisporangium ochraceum]
MHTNYAVGRLGVELTREASRSALPHAPVTEDRPPAPAAFRVRIAGALHRLADRIGPVDARAGHSPLQHV